MTTRIGVRQLVSIVVSIMVNPKLGIVKGNNKIGRVLTVLLGKAVTKDETARTLGPTHLRWDAYLLFLGYRAVVGKCQIATENRSPATGLPAARGRARQNLVTLPPITATSW